MTGFTVTHFQTEFIQQGQATILRRVTMTQFGLMIGLTLLGVGLLPLPAWLAPLFVGLGYVAGYRYRGALLWRRLLSLLWVWGRQLLGRPRLVTLDAAWLSAATLSSATLSAATLSAATLPSATLPAAQTTNHSFASGAAGLPAEEVA